MSDLLREALDLANRVCGSRAVRLYDDDLYDLADAVGVKLEAALAAAAPPPDRNDLLAVGRAQSQHDAGGSRSSPASLPSTDKPLGMAYLTRHQVVICGVPPPEDGGWPDDDPRRHNCDAMGCGQEHVLARLTKPEWMP